MGGAGQGACAAPQLHLAAQQQLSTTTVGQYFCDSFCLTLFQIKQIQVNALYTVSVNVADEHRPESSDLSLVV